MRPAWHTSQHSRALPQGASNQMRMAQIYTKKILYWQRNQKVMENNLKQHQIIATLCEKAQQAINEAYHTIEYDCDGYENGEEIVITHTTPCGVIELYCEINEPWEVYIDNTTAHKLSNIHEALRKALPPYEFDFEQAREELARSSYELSSQEYEMSSTGYFL